MFKDLKNTAILVDFDGTITEIDTNVKLINTFAGKEYKKVKKMHREDKISLLDSIRLQYEYIKLTEDEYVDFILNEINISEGFIDFYENIKEYDIPFAIVSGGFENGIRPFLNKHGINPEEVDIFANRFIFNGRDIGVEFYDEDYECEFNIEPCGNCKINHYERYKKENKEVIFIGDGWTDRCVAHKTDVLFAKDGLVDYCKQNNIEYIPWEDFRDVNKLLFK